DANPSISTAWTPNKKLSFDKPSIVASVTFPTSLDHCHTGDVVSRQTTRYPATSGSTFASQLKLVLLVNPLSPIFTLDGEAGANARVDNAAPFTLVTRAIYSKSTNSGKSPY